MLKTAKKQQKGASRDSLYLCRKYYTLKHVKKNAIISLIKINLQDKNYRDYPSIKNGQRENSPYLIGSLTFGDNETRLLTNAGRHTITCLTRIYALILRSATGSRRSRARYVIVNRQLFQKLFIKHYMFGYLDTHSQYNAIIANLHT